MVTMTPKTNSGWRTKAKRFCAPIPLLGWLLGALGAVILEHLAGDPFSELLGLPKIPVLFGALIMLKKPLLIPSVLLYVLVIYGMPLALVGKLFSGLANRAAEKLLHFSKPFSVLIHLALLYAILHTWSDLSAYRLLTLKFTLIAIMLTLSLNVINGYMGEFSCSHPGFMALGAYAASTFPSFRTRGDYLAIISLAFMFIVKSLFENLEIMGGPRGMGSQPNWANLPTVFIWTVLCVWMINNFVQSTMGKALNAVRDDETAADAMTVNTRKTKMVGFLFAAFWAGVAGGLFAHVLRYINPGTFGIQRLAEMLAMVYFGGLNSVYGSIMGAVSLSLLSEALRPLEILKWIIIPLMLILVMIFRPTGLIAFKEFNVGNLIKPKNTAPIED
ncbi:MAG: branched-chain amino acid ABC transporter permease [Desulfobacteraceae bacterium 4572_87]|nr:MAG: branched-chain amino acid ABC transporter permease [Desulfobacteraceae bacterium 4572_87]